MISILKTFRPGRVSNSIDSVAKDQGVNPAQSTPIIVSGPRLSNVNRESSVENTVNSIVSAGTSFNTNNFSESHRAQETENLERFKNNIAVPLRALVYEFSNLRITEKETANKGIIYEITRNGSYEEMYCSEPFKYIISNQGVMKLFLASHGIKEEFPILKNGVFLTNIVKETLSKLANSNHVFCVGLGNDSREIIKSLVTTPKQLRTIEYPYPHLASSACEGWFVKPENQPIEEVRNLCANCKYLRRYLRVCGKRRQEAIKSPARLKRMQPSHTCPTKFLSPPTLMKKRKLSSFRHQNMKIKAAKLATNLKDLKKPLHHEQHKEMTEVVSKITKDFTPELNDVLSHEEGADESVKECYQRLRDSWNEDCETYLKKEREDFLNDQSRNAFGSKGNQWSLITYRIALAVACRSRAAYEALLSFKILNLPSWRSIQRKTSKNLDEPGINHAYLREQKETYDIFVKEQILLGHAEPKCDGVLVFDEVKVCGKLIWNSKNNRLIGLSMPPDEYAFLDDLYQELTDEKEISKANYMMQFLWRDLTSNYDIIGPYFSLSSTADAHTTFGCLFQALKAFQIHGFNVSGVVCDGASANLAVIKQCVGLQGTFSYKNTEEFNINVNASFPNPFKLGRSIHFIICPSHQLKNLVNALFASHSDRAKEFIIDGTEFGWQQIIDLKKRDDQRSAKSIPRFVPKLLQSYIDRDAWTKLNVKPARILQQNDVLSELYEYANPKEGKPDDAPQVMCTYAYLKACQYLFEDGMLSRMKVKNITSPTLENLDKGLNYFTEWLKQILNDDPEYNPSNPRQKKFLSWQTWALLRIMVFGMKSLAEEFFKTYTDGNYYLCPLRINGSAVETLFSQYKHSAGGKLTSVNFNTSRKNVLTTRDVKGHHSGKGYRDVPLYVREAFDQKFKTNK